MVDVGAEGVDKRVNHKRSNILDNEDCTPRYLRT
jgi:hypothetical protein